MELENLLELKNLKLDLMSVRGIVHALNGVNMEIRPGEIHGLVGESGSGKSMTSKSIMRLHNEQRSRMSGEILFHGLCQHPKTVSGKRRVALLVSVVSHHHIQHQLFPVFGDRTAPRTGF